MKCKYWFLSFFKNNIKDRKSISNYYLFMFFGIISMMYLLTVIFLIPDTKKCHLIFQRVIFLVEVRECD